MKPRIAVVGGGVAGLTAALTVARQGYEPVVLEESARLGGRLATRDLAGRGVDVGAQFIGSFNAEALGMLANLDPPVDLVASRAAAVFRRRGTETPTWPPQRLLTGSFLSPIAKLRLLGGLLAMAPYWPRLRSDDPARSASAVPESMATFGSRWFGTEATQEFIAPILRALLYWEVESTSTGIVLLMMKEGLRSTKTYVPVGGMRSIVTALAKGLGTITNASVRSLDVQRTRVRVGFDLDGSAEELSVHGVVLATTADRAAPLAASLGPDAQDFLTSVSYTSSAMACFSVPLRCDPPRAFVLFSPAEVPELTGLNPRWLLAGGEEDDVVLTISLSDAGYHRWGSLPDEALGRKILSVVERHGAGGRWSGAASLLGVQRWPRALPRFPPGYGQSLVSRRDLEATSNVPVVLAGDYLEGPLIEGAVRSGRVAAQQIVATVRAQGRSSRP